MKYARCCLLLVLAMAGANSACANDVAPPEKNGDTKCLSYGNRTVVQGLLNNYPAGRGWILDNPQPNCITEDPSKRLFRPGRNDLSTTILTLAPNETAKYRKYAGQQVTVSGMLTLVVDGDVMYFKLSNIRAQKTP